MVETVGIIVLFLMIHQVRDGGDIVFKPAQFALQVAHHRQPQQGKLAIDLKLDQALGQSPGLAAAQPVILHKDTVEPMLQEGMLIQLEGVIGLGSLFRHLGCGNIFLTDNG
ncbi:MAG: Uncharacterised protein [SAR116 cluster bacterium MED-G04]|nr:MAG: Uncharacterised protein [SAR116 cluster bacterium MED-G04]